MIKSLNEDTALKFKTLPPEEKQQRGILGRLYGKVADFTNGTRNGRKYSLKLWEKLFNSDIIKERFQNGGIFGELCHPDYEEVDMQKVAVIMPEPPVKDKDGQLVAYLDILDTPCGKVAYQLAKYGYKFGISSRGSGDIITDQYGEEAVDPDTYFLNAFDLVEIPAVKSARLTFVESLETGNNLKTELRKSLDNASESERKIMTEALDTLGVNLKEDINSYSQSENSVNNIEEQEASAVDDIEAQDGLISQLHESLQTQQKLLDTVQSLQEKLSVSYAKETQQQEEIEKYQRAVQNLRNKVVKQRVHNDKVDSLTEELNESKQQLKSQEAKIQDLTQRLSVSTKQAIKLNENYDNEKQSLTEQVSSLQNKLTTASAKLEQEKINHKQAQQKLIEDYQDKIKDASLKQKELNKKVTYWKQLAEKYQKISLKAVDKYIESKALSLGISENEIKNRLSENYTFSEIDEICENLRQYRLNLSNLPFNSTSVSKQLSESSIISTKNIKNKSILPKGYESVDEIDEQLLELAGIT